MSSWIHCPCGNQIHKNLFSGANVCLVVEDEMIDKLDDQIPAAEAIHQMILHSDILVRCPKCGRIAVEDNKTGAIAIYAKENSQG